MKPLLNWKLLMGLMVITTITLAYKPGKTPAFGNTDTPVYKLVNELGEVLDFVDSKQLALTEKKELKVIADGFRIRSMKIILARDSNIIAELETASGLIPPNIYAICKPGDRLIIAVKKITKLLPDGKEQDVDPGSGLKVDVR